MLALALEIKQSVINSQPPRANNTLKVPTFVRGGKKTPKNPFTKSESGKLCQAHDWKMLADISKHLISPSPTSGQTW